MIAFLQGNPIAVNENRVVINVRGVGYELSCSQPCIDEISGKDFVQLWVYTHVREDQISLYGFTSTQEKTFFMSLLEVNGIGPKMAVNILSAAPFARIAQWIEQGDVQALTQLPKLGKKKAEQIILTLKGQLVLAGDGIEKRPFAARGEIVSALVNLGFRLNDVESVVSGMKATTDLQTGIREGLHALTQRP